MNRYFSHNTKDILDFAYYGDTTIFCDADAYDFPCFTEVQINLLIENLPEARKKAFRQLEEGNSLLLGKTPNSTGRYLYKLTKDNIAELEALAIETQKMVQAQNEVAQKSFRFRKQLKFLK